MINDDNEEMMIMRMQVPCQWGGSELDDDDDDDDALRLWRWSQWWGFRWRWGQYSGTIAVQHHLVSTSSTTLSFLQILNFCRQLLFFSPGQFCRPSERAGRKVFSIIAVIALIVIIIIIILILIMIMTKQVGRLLGYSGGNLGGRVEGAMAAITGYEVTWSSW